MKQKRDLTNEKFGQWTVLNFDNKNEKKGRRWICRCSCGTVKSVKEDSLLRGDSKSCGCSRKKHLKQPLDLTFETFGELLVLKEAPDEYTKGGACKTCWYCRCSCGKIKKIRTTALRDGTTISCGHIGKQRRKEANENRFLENLSYEPIKNGIIPIKKLESKIQKGGQKKTLMLFQCYCGNYFTATLDSVKNGNTNSCGCYKKQVASERAIDMVGKKFNKLTVLERGPDKYFPNSNTHMLTWVCQCDCGSITTVAGYKLRTGTTKSCGCLLSYGNEMVGKYLRDHEIEYETEYKFDDLRSDTNYPLRFDFAIFNKGTLLGLIEYQGIQHYKDINGFFGNRQRLVTDPLKKEYCQRNNIKLFEIRYDEDIDKRCEEILTELHVNTVPSVA